MAKKKFSNPLLNSLAEFYRKSVRTMYACISLLQFIKKPNNNWWAFPVHYIQGSFSDNMLAVFEQVKDDPSIKKVIFTKKRKVDTFGAVNVLILDIYTLKGIIALAKCKVIFLHHTVDLDFSIKWKFYSKLLLKRAIGVNLWHGIAIKKIRASLPNVLRTHEHGYYKMVICSSKVDRLVMASAFYPLTWKNIPVTGLPRNDYLLKPESELPEIYTRQLSYIEDIKKGRKLIIYAPTFRDSRTHYEFTDAEITRLKEVLKANNAILGFRVHYFVFQTANSYLKLIDDNLFFDLGQKKVDDMNMLLRKADLIVTDYSSLFVDAMLLDKPMISFAYDMDQYRDQERGFYYPFDMVFPGNVHTRFDDVINDIQSSLQGNYNLPAEKSLFLKNLFFEYTDAGSSARVVACVKSMIANKKLN